jgi:hypothetical protein
MNFAFDWDEVNTLIHILHAKGIAYLMGSELLSDDVREDDPARLIQRLAACGYPLIEDASIALFIMHPELAPAVVEALQASEPDVAEKIAVLTLATLYLQQWWLFRLAFALGRLSSFPEAPFVALWETRHPPPPSSGYGLDGLLALQTYQQQRSGLPLNFRDGWQNQINHLLALEEAHQRPLPDDLIQILRQTSMVYVAQCMEREQIA